MAGVPQPDSKTVPRKDTSLFNLRVCLSSPEDSLLAHHLFRRTEVVVAGCNSSAYCIFGHPDPKKITLVLTARYDPGLWGAAKVSTHMVFLDKTGSPVPSMGTETHEEEFCYLRAASDAIKANCVVDNYFEVLCSVDIERTPWASSVEEILPDLGRDLALMSDKQDLTDVSFDIGGESFDAHRLVLATRSPVFRAELYGPMAESKMTSITIQDMEASTFRSMLHYMYRGSLTDAAAEDVCLTMAEYQHLLVAADRYRVESLKKICEEKLCHSGITIDNVVSMLELAEDHVCPKLKTSCFDFLAKGENFRMVGTSAEYVCLMQSFSNLLVEMRDWFKMLHEKPGMLEPAPHKKTRWFS